MSDALTPVGFYHCTRSRPFDVVPVLAGKAIEAGHRVLVHASHGNELDALDSHLWTYDPGSFLPHGRDNPAVQPVLVGRGRDEVRQRVRAARHRGGIDPSFAKPREETPGPLLHHVAARAEQRRARRERAAEREQVVLVAAGAVQEEERGRGRLGARFEEVLVGEGRHVEL